jgi:hypothetical protein
MLSASWTVLASGDRQGRPGELISQPPGSEPETQLRFGMASSRSVSPIYYMLLLICYLLFYWRDGSGWVSSGEVVYLIHTVRTPVVFFGWGRCSDHARSGQRSIPGSAVNREATDSAVVFLAGEATYRETSSIHHGGYAGAAETCSGRSPVRATTPRLVTHSSRTGEGDSVANRLVIIGKTCGP